MQYDTHSKFSHTTLLLHWLVGLTIIGILASGVYMVEENAYWVFSWPVSYTHLTLPTIYSV